MLIQNTFQPEALISKTLGLDLEGLSAEALMLQVQMLSAKDFDEQMRVIGSKIKFLNHIKKSYRENINTVQEFLAQNPNTKRKDGKKYYDATFEQMRDLYSAFTKFDYDLESQTVEQQNLKIKDNGDKHTVDDEDYFSIVNGESSTADWVKYFNKGTTIEDPKQAREFADLVSDDDGALPFYYGHINNKDEKGYPLFAAFADPIDKMLEQVKNDMSDVEEEAEQLSVDLNQIVSQRKAALDGANQVLRKMEEIKSNTMSKI